MRKWIVLICLAVGIVGGVIYSAATEKSSNVQSLALIAKDSPSPNFDVYIYRFHDGQGGHYLFAVASRNFKDGVAITQLKP